MKGKYGVEERKQKPFFAVGQEISFHMRSLKYVNYERKSGISSYARLGSFRETHLVATTDFLSSILVTAKGVRHTLSSLKRHDIDRYVHFIAVLRAFDSIILDSLFMMHSVVELCRSYCLFQELKERNVDSLPLNITSIITLSRYVPHPLARRITVNRRG